MSEPYIGEIRALPYTFAPLDWLAFEGQLLPVAQYQALFAVIGNVYGGNGQTNFALPDLRGRTIISMGQGPGLQPRVLGGSGGSEKVGLNLSNLPSHSHPLSANAKATLKASSAVANVKDPAGNSLSANATEDNNARYNTADADTAMNAKSIDASGNVENAGGNDTHDNMQPSLVIRYCIATQGIFPVRS
jgi:microcystin-dependent protein